jgi:hypothetical protein
MNNKIEFQIHNTLFSCLFILELFRNYRLTRAHVGNYLEVIGIEILTGKNYSKKFDTILVEAIDEAFSSLGEKAKSAVYSYLEKMFLIPKKDIPYRLEDFSDSLRKIFGLASKHLEILIMINLNRKLSCSYKWKGPSWLVPELTFRQYVELSRVNFEGEGKIGEVEVCIDVEEKPRRLIKR